MDDKVLYDLSKKESEECFYHHGITDMTWYNRRFQYKDGTWTPEGKARRREQYAKQNSGESAGYGRRKKKKEKEEAKAAKEESTEKKEPEKKDSEKKDSEKKDANSPAKTVASIGRDTRNVFNETDNIIDIVVDANGRKQRANVDLSSISDDELNRIINRLGLEKRYMDAVYPNRNEKAEKAKAFIATLSSLTAIGFSIASIALTIKELKKR